MAASDEARTIGRYELLFELAAGGMGRVYVARQVGDAGFERIVALKRVHAHLAADPEVYAMASDEARLSALLHHPNVVSVIDVVDAAGELVLVMDYVEGVSLASLLKGRDPSDGPLLPLPILSRVLCDALRGLGAAHAARDLTGESIELVHRDVSPQNLLVGADGSTRLIDFGIARAEGRLASTKTGVIKGKVVYMAPERLEEAAVDRRADLFSVGAVLYEIVSGEWAFGSGDEAAQMSKILLGEIDLSRVTERAPELVPICEKALARRPRDRFSTAEAFAEALARAVPPAEPAAVAALVARSLGVDLEARRERIAHAIAARAALVDESTDVGPLGAAPSPRAPSGREARGTDPGSPRAPGSLEEPAVARPRLRASPWAVGLGVAALLVNAAGWLVSTRPPAVGPPTSPTSSTSSTSPTSSEALVASTEALHPAASAPSSPVTVGSSPRPSTEIPPAASASASPTTRPPGLEPSPYGDLRKSPYKHP